jgi:hypothetical protein
VKQKIISLFSGAGGLDFGFEAAGFETSVALDLDRKQPDSGKGMQPFLSAGLRANRSQNLATGFVGMLRACAIPERRP